MSDPFKSGVFFGALLVAGSAGTMFAMTQISRMGHPPVIGVQRGFRGTGLVQIYDPRRQNWPCRPPSPPSLRRPAPMG